MLSSYHQEIEILIDFINKAKEAILRAILRVRCYLDHSHSYDFSNEIDSDRYNITHGGMKLLLIVCTFEENTLLSLFELDKLKV